MNQNFPIVVIILFSFQSGSGKTYTMWGPPSAMVDDPSPHSHQGIVPRLFQVLFSEIEKVCICFYGFCIPEFDEAKEER